MLDYLFSLNKIIFGRGRIQFFSFVSSESYVFDEFSIITYRDVSKSRTGRQDGLVARTAFEGPCLEHTQIPCGCQFWSQGALFPI